MRNECFHPTSVAFVFRPEMSAHPSLFEHQFTYKRDDDDREAKARLNRADSDDRAEQRQKNSAINWVPNPCVGAGLNHPMINFESDAATPVFSEVVSCPGGDTQPEHCQTKTDGQRYPDGGQRSRRVGIREGLDEISKITPTARGTLYEAPVSHDSVCRLAAVWRAATIQ